MKKGKLHGLSRRNITLPEAVAARIRELRMVLDWSQQKLAEEAGLTKDAVSRIERGDRNPRLVTLDQIARATGCPLLKLLDVEGMPPQIPPRPRDLQARTILRSVDQLEPRLINVVITLLHGLVKAQQKRAREGW